MGYVALLKQLPLRRALRVFLLYVGLVLFYRYLYPGWTLGPSILGIVAYKATLALALMLLLGWLGVLHLPGAEKALGVLQAAACVCIALASHPTLEVPLFINPGMAACLVALIPLRSPLAKLGSLPLIALTHARTPWLILGAQALISSLRLRYKLLLVAMGGICLVLRPGLLDSGHRFEVWLGAFTWWVQQPWDTFFLGLGVGTGYAWLPETQSSLDFFMVLHNDWLQLFFELGVLGSLLLYRVLRVLWREHPERHPLYVSVAAWMCTDYPWHWGWVAILLGPLIVSERGPTRTRG